MAPPSPPDWRSGNPLDWWFLVGETEAQPGSEGRTWGIATQGMTAAKRIQRALNEYFNGRLTPALQVDAVLGDRTLGRLEAAAQEHRREDPAGGYGVLVDNIARDRRQRTISPLTLRWALWLAYVRTNPDLRRLGYASVLIPARATLPSFGVAPDDDRNAGGSSLQAVQWLYGVQDPPRAPARSSTSTPLGSSAPSTPQPQQTGAQTGTGGGAQTVTTGREPGATVGGAPSSALAPTTPTTAGSFLETETAGIKHKWWLAGLGVVALVGVATYGSSKGARGRSTTRYVYGRSRGGYRRLAR
jgi:hypothetical protein